MFVFTKSNLNIHIQMETHTHTHTYFRIELFCETLSLFLVCCCWRIFMCFFLFWTKIIMKWARVNAICWIHLMWVHLFTYIPFAMRNSIHFFFSFHCIFSIILFSKCTRSPAITNKNVEYNIRVKMRFSYVVTLCSTLIKKNECANGVCICN